MAWSGEEMERTIDEWRADDVTYKKAVDHLLSDEEDRQKLLNFVSRYATTMKDKDDIKEAFSKSEADQEETLMASLSPNPRGQQDDRKGVFGVLSPGQIALAAMMFMNNDHASGWIKRYEVRHEKSTNRTGYGKWNTKGGKKKFGSGMDPKAMEMYEQVRLLCGAIRRNEELMKALRMESLMWWDEHHVTEEKKSKRKSVVKDKSNDMELPVPICPPLEGCDNGYDHEAWLNHIEETATAKLDI